MKLFIILTAIIATQAEVYLYEYIDSDIRLNGKQLRETIGSNYFASNYNYETNNQPKIFQTNEYYQGTTLLKNYKETAKIGEIKYNKNKPHYFNYVLNLVSEGDVKMILTYNNKVINLSEKNNISIKETLKQDRGEHNYKLYLVGNDFCNCPSLKDGYRNTRFFFGWITEDKLNTTISTIYSNDYSNNIINPSNIIKIV